MINLKNLFLTTLFVLPMFSKAYALDVKIDNKTDATVTFSFSYLDKKENDWVVDGWYNVEPNSLSQVNLDTDNDIYYLYAQFSNGKKLEGGKGSVLLGVDKRSFFYKQGKTPANAKMKVNFVRARGNNGVALIKVK